MRLWVGGYGDGHGGSPAEGIGMLHAGDPGSDSASGALSFAGTAVAAPSPSWVAAHPDAEVVYAALEDSGAVQAFRRVAEDRLTPLGGPVAAGEAVCHIAVAPDGGFLLASCWGDGRLVRVPVARDGALGAPVVAPAAVDPYGSDGAPAGASDPAVDVAVRAVREAAGEEYAHLLAGIGEQEHDHAAPTADAPTADAGAAASDRVSRSHQALFLPGGVVVTTDLGLDLVRVWRVEGGRLGSRQQVVLPRGSGPRHMVWHPSGHLYVVTEYSREVFVLAADAAGRWRVLGGAPAAPGSLDGDTAAELAASRDGRFLYAGIRGSDTLAVLRVRGGGEAVEPAALVEAGVRKPRHHVVVGDTLLVAGQASDEVVSLGLDPRTGVPGGIRHSTPVPAPTCLLPRR